MLQFTSPVTVPIQKLCCLQRYTPACRKSMFQGTQSIKKTSSTSGFIGIDIEFSRTAFSKPLSGCESCSKFPCCCVCTEVSVTEHIFESAPACICLPREFHTKEECPLPFSPVDHIIQTQIYKSSLHTQCFHGRERQENVWVQLFEHNVSLFILKMEKSIAAVT